MKLLSYLTLFCLLFISACSHHKKSCCADKNQEASSCAKPDCKDGSCKKTEAMTCAKPDCKKACCDKDKKCADGSCVKEEKKTETAPVTAPAPSKKKS